jgi:hypothetical protein
MITASPISDGKNIVNDEKSRQIRNAAGKNFIARVILSFVLLNTFLNTMAGPSKIKLNCQNHHKSSRLIFILQDSFLFF